MGRKRKTDTQEVKAINGSTDAAFSKDKTDNSNAKNVENVDNVKKTPNAAPLKKYSRVMELALRRSVRINSPGSLSRSLKARPIVEHVGLVGNEQEEVDASPLMENNSEREAETPEMNEESLEEKVDYLIRTANELKSKFVRRGYARTDEGSPDFSYKSLYIESQKQIEALMEEHYDLVRKLEFAHGKIEAYESMKNALIAQKEVILVSSLAKATEPQPAASPPPPPPSPPAATIAAASKSPKQKKDNRKKQVSFRINSN